MFNPCMPTVTRDSTVWPFIGKRVTSRTESALLSFTQNERSVSTVFEPDPGIVQLSQVGVDVSFYGIVRWGAARVANHVSRRGHSRTTARNRRRGIEITESCHDLIDAVQDSQAYKDSVTWVLRGGLYLCRFPPE
jgi:hypothetical protein